MRGPRPSTSASDMTFDGNGNNYSLPGLSTDLIPFAEDGQPLCFQLGSRSPVREPESKILDQPGVEEEHPLLRMDFPDATSAPWRMREFKQKEMTIENGHIHEIRDFVWLI